MTQSLNPLSRFFRQPQLYIKLPSLGRWWPPDSLDMPPNQELPVYAMTAADEIMFKTPDAVMNGQSTVDVIQSCIPNIKNAWLMPITDIDTVLISIRQATYGNEMQFVSLCPHCKTKHDHVADLSVIVDRITCPDYDKTIKIKDLEIFLKPQLYKDFNNQSMNYFEQQKLLAVTADESMSAEDKLASFAKHFRQLVKLTVDQLANNIAAIKLPDNQLVDSAEYIHEFFSNCDKEIWTAVKARLEEFNKEQVAQKTYHLTCENPECAKEYSSPLEFETSNFFG